MAKKRIVKDYDALPEDVIAQVKLHYPEGFALNLISYVNAKGDTVSALPFETDEIYYLIRMTVKEARQIIADDDDYDEDGILRDDYEDDLDLDGYESDDEEEDEKQDKFVDIDEVADSISDED